MFEPGIATFIAAILEILLYIATSLLFYKASIVFEPVLIHYSQAIFLIENIIISCWRIFVVFVPHLYLMVPCIRGLDDFYTTVDVGLFLVRSAMFSRQISFTPY